MVFAHLQCVTRPSGHSFWPGADSGSHLPCHSLGALSCLRLSLRLSQVAALESSGVRLIFCALDLRNSPNQQIEDLVYMLK